MMGQILFAIGILLSKNVFEDRKSRIFPRLASPQHRRTPNQGYSPLKGVLASVMFGLALISLSVMGLVEAADSCPPTYEAGDDDSACWETLNLYDPANDQISTAPSGHFACGIKVNSDTTSYSFVDGI